MVNMWCDTLLGEKIEGKHDEGVWEEAINCD